ncbi:MAG: glycosyltransferase family 2 protein [Spirochaetaceae bacterium]|nr:glycosyltransferase family 2 protein [Myxococcales bacterium]MCB9725339.1 glycosyltransferase family 2 protein [Spirochaetaceae bacterium]HPG24874.1 glycosyltransferase family 2 protein [Myxococcota bacterium]
MKLLAIIVNYKTPEMTLEAVAALHRELARQPEARVVVVDNDSRDGSYERLAKGVAEGGYGDRVEVVASPWNGGFAWGNNFAIRPALASETPPDYVYLLNSDAFPDEGSVDRLIRYLDEHPEVGIAGSYIHGVDGQPHTTAFRFPSVASEFEATLGIGVVSKLLARFIVAPPLPTTNTRVDWLAGASMLIRRAVLEDVGLMDEGYFLYFEETDFCLRAARAGWPTVYVRESSVSHVGSASTGYQDLSRPTPAYWYASRRRYFLRNHGRATLWLANAVYIVGGLIRRARSFVLQRPSHEPRRHMRDFLRFNLRLGPQPDVHPPRPAALRATASTGVAPVRPECAR